MGSAQGLGSVRAVAMGVPGSGKTHFLTRYFLPRERRLLVVDRTGEWRRLLPAAPRVVGLGATLDALRRAATAREWRVVAVLSNEELEELTTYVLLAAPEPESGFAASVGGMGIALDEVDLVVPNGYARPALAGLWRLGRHARLSVYAATQKPSRVSKEVTAMSEYLAILRLHEVRCLKYVRDVLGEECYAWGVDWFRREEHGCLLYHTPTGRAHKITPAGRIAGSFDPADTAAPARPRLEVIR